MDGLGIIIYLNEDSSHATCFSSRARWDGKMGISRCVSSPSVSLNRATAAGGEDPSAAEADGRDEGHARGHAKRDGAHGCAEGLVVVNNAEGDDALMPMGGETSAQVPQSSTVHCF